MSPNLADYSFRAVRRNPFTGAFGVAYYPATHYNRVTRAVPLEWPRHDFDILVQDGANCFAEDNCTSSLIQSPRD